MAGRPSKYNKGIHQSICEALAAGMSRTTAAEVNGIDRSTLEDWRVKYSTFSRDVTTAMAKAKRRATLTITQAIQAGDVQAAFRYLSYQERDEWADPKGDINLNLTINLQEIAAKVAQDYGLDPAAVIKEAEAILAGRA
jgi:hypothetical protein